MGCVIFDLDGTLADTSADLIAAANTRLAARGGATLDPVADAATAFAGGRAMLRLGFERAGFEEDRIAGEVEAGFAPFVAAYSVALDRETRLYPGVREAVAALAGAGYRLGVCTNKPIRQAEDLLRLLDFRAPFASCVGADTLEVRKPHPAPLEKAVTDAGGEMARTVLIGDTVTDRDTARAAGAKVALVTFGPTGRAVEDLAPDALLDHFDDLPGLAARLLAR